MRCPACDTISAAPVVDSRSNDTGTLTRRRRECVQCRARFTTYEQAIDPRVFDAQRLRAKAIAQQLRDMASTLDVW